MRVLLLLVCCSGFCSQSFSQTEQWIFDVAGKQDTVEIQFTSKDTVNGKCTAVFAANPEQTAFEYSYKNGKRVGRYLSYYPNGNFRETAVYGYGALQGEYTAYNSLGEIIEKGKYKEGEKHGFWIWKWRGIKGNFSKGEKNRKWVYYNEDGSTCVEMWAKGKLLYSRTKKD